MNHKVAHYNAAIKNREHLHVSGPCDRCITLAMCLQKTSYQLSDCELLYPIFIKHGKHIDIDCGTFITVEALNHVQFLLTRPAHDYIVLDTLNSDGELDFFSVKINLIDHRCKDY